MPVSLYGQPADMDEINAIADTYNLTVIEDGAQSFWATYIKKVVIYQLLDVQVFFQANH